jgi:hypothetical protein
MKVTSARGQAAGEAYAARTWHSTSGPARPGRRLGWSQPEQHTRVAQGVRLDAIQVEELRDAVII